MAYMGKKDRKRKGSKSERFKVDETMAAPDVAGYLEGIAKGLRDGTIDLGEQGSSFRVAVADEVGLEVKARHRKDRSKIKVKLSFRRPETKGKNSDDESAPEKTAAGPATIPDEMSF